MAPVYLQTRYRSAYSLLGAMASELATALRAQGHEVREPDASDSPTRGTYIFFNAPPTIDALPPALLTQQSDLRAVQIFVDHPYALPAGPLDAWQERNGLTNLRLCLPCADDLHLLGHRWPALRHEWVRHAIPRAALCPHEDLTEQRWLARPHDIVIAGSIAPEHEINERLSAMPRRASGIVRACADLMLREPAVGFVQALSLTSPRAMEWSTQSTLWQTTIMIVNRARRLALVRALGGLNITLFGNDAWQAESTGTTRYMGNADYAGIAKAFASARIAIAWGPTQFAHSYSERLMLAMAAGCAPISDDRLLVRRDFPDSCAIYNAAYPRSARTACEHLLANPTQALELATKARAHAERECLWEHRVDQLLGLKSPAPQPV